MIVVLRLAHRRERDKRVSTHVGLVSRALGADKIIYTGDDDKNLLKSINKLVKNWGGNFKTEYASDYKKVLKKYSKFKIVHLTMYGLSLDKQADKIKKHKNLLIIVGGEKVPSEVYELADYNISVTNQPHSEIAALALTLDKITSPKKFNNAKMQIKPSIEGKEFY
jgi:tRNA (cytidine56-2'-O)-methyltransferase